MKYGESLCIGKEAGPWVNRSQKLAFIGQGQESCFHGVWALLHEFPTARNIDRGHAFLEFHAVKVSGNDYSGLVPVSAGMPDGRRVEMPRPYVFRGE